MNKKKAYEKLILCRQKFKFPEGLRNYTEFKPRNNEFVDGWEQWQADLDAKIMLVGQDYTNWEGFEMENRDAKYPKLMEKKYINPTNKHLSELFYVLGYKITPERLYQKNKGLFFTNAVVGLKSGNMQAKIKTEWWKDGAQKFLKPLIEIIRPDAIIALGQIPFKAIFSIFSEMVKRKSLPNSVELMKKSPYSVTIESSKKIHVFPVYHCGGRGISMRNLDTQKDDWKRIKYYLFNQRNRS